MARSDGTGWLEDAVEQAAQSVDALEKAFRQRFSRPFGSRAVSGPEQRQEFQVMREQGLLPRFFADQQLTYEEAVFYAHQMTRGENAEGL